MLAGSGRMRIAWSSTTRSTALSNKADCSSADSGGRPCARRWLCNRSRKAIRCVAWIPGRVTIVSAKGKTVAIRDFSRPSASLASGCSPMIVGMWLVVSG